MTLTRLAWFAGEIARPWCLISIGTGTAWSIFSASDASIITAAGFIVAALYGAKAAEEFGKNRNAAKVEEAKAREPGA